MNIKLKIIPSLKILKTMEGEHLGYSKWYKVDQNIINKFAEATHDFQWIHIDEEKAKKHSPFKNTIAHGYFTLSLLPMFISQVWKCEDTSLVLNYGSDKIRFITPVVCNNLIRASIMLISTEDYKNGLKVKTLINVEIKDNKKIAMSAEVLSLLIAK